VKAMVFPVVTYGCETWIIKKAECQRTDAFELWCWRRLLRVPWTGGWGDQTINSQGNQSWIFIGSTDVKPETPILWPPDAKNWLKRLWCWERLKAGGEGDDKGWYGWMASWTQWTWDWASSRNWWWTGKPGVLQSMGLQKVGHDWATELNWTELIIMLIADVFFFCHHIFSRSWQQYYILKSVSWIMKPITSFPRDM